MVLCGSSRRGEGEEEVTMVAGEDARYSLWDKRGRVIARDESAL